MALEKLPDDVLRTHKGISYVGVTTVFFVHDGNGNFFFAKRSNNARDEKGKWEAGGGGLKWGVLAEENMRREVKEEYNGDVIESEFIGYQDALRTLDDGTKTHWVALIFAAKVDPENIKINEPDMFDDAGWFALDEFPHPQHSQTPLFIERFGDKLRALSQKP